MIIRRISAALLSLAVAAGTVPTAFAEDTAEEYKGIVVLHTNDVHCGVNADDDTFGYADLAAYKAKLEEEGYAVVLADAGDFTQGDVIGTLSDGEYLIDIMNHVGYSVAVPGNHEFDYGMEQFYNFKNLAEFELVTCNVAVGDERTGLLDAGYTAEVAGYRIGFLGILTPQTLTSTNPQNFVDENGELIYDFFTEYDGEQLYAQVQRNINGFRAECDLDYLIALGHLGTDDSGSNPWTSYGLIENTYGIDMMIDGHSHSVIEGEVLKNNKGEEVLLSSAGTKLANIGKVVITEEGITAELISKDEYTVTDDTDTAEYKAYADTDEYIKGKEAEYAETVNTVVATTDVDLTTMDPENPDMRIIRNQETNLGDLCADAYRIMMGADCSLINGGGVRADIKAGDITYGDIISVNPFGNEICLVEATGQELLDALEIGSMLVPEENGSFFHVSGITYEIHSYIPTPVVLDDNWTVIEIKGERRVKNVTVGGEPIDPDKTYTMASHNYLIKSGGCECAMFMDNKLLADSIILDNRILIDYIVEELGGVIGEEYADPLGDGRIVIVSEAEAGDVPTEEAPDKTSPDTGAEGVAVTAAVSVVAVAVLFAARKRQK